jgi:hypothetical protein
MKSSRVQSRARAFIAGVESGTNRGRPPFGSRSSPAESPCRTNKIRPSRSTSSQRSVRPRRDEAPYRTGGGTPRRPDYPPARAPRSLTNRRHSWPGGARPAHSSERAPQLPRLRSSPAQPAAAGDVCRSGRRVRCERKRIAPAPICEHRGKDLAVLVDVARSETLAVERPKELAQLSGRYVRRGPIPNAFMIRPSHPGGRRFEPG